MMAHYDLCVIWYWEYDADFIAIVQAACNAQGISLWSVSPENLPQATADLLEGRAGFAALLDRAQFHAGFTPLLRKAREMGAYCINPRERSAWAEDKATMHLEMISRNLETPYTIILAPFVEQPILPALNMVPLGGHFVIKPAVGGGGEGVILHASTLEQVRQARIEFADQKYLLQAHIEPQELAGRKAWFRNYYVDGNVHCCWWHPRTHIFTRLHAEEEQLFGLHPLRHITAQIASICQLDWFSTEIALSMDGKFVTVDYVNDSIDLRLQSKAIDGVPEEVVKAIAEDLVALAKRQQKTASSD